MDGSVFNGSDGCCSNGLTSGGTPGCGAAAERTRRPWQGGRRPGRTAGVLRALTSRQACCRA